VDASPELHPLVAVGSLEKLLSLVQENAIKFCMTFLDGTNIRTHQKAAGASRKGDLRKSEMIAKRLADLVEAMKQRLA
jgi:hypothetical protein